MDIVKKNLTSLVFCCSSTLTVELLNKYYRKEVGECIPYRKFGFNSFEQLLRSIEAIQVCGSGPSAEVLPVESHKPFICMHLVCRERNFVSKKRNQRRHSSTRKEENKDNNGIEFGDEKFIEFGDCLKLIKENNNLRKIIDKTRRKNDILDAANESLSLNIKQLEGETAPLKSAIENTHSAPVAQHAGQSNEMAVQQSASAISNSNMVNCFYQNRSECTEWDSDDDNHTTMENELGRDQTPKGCLDSRKVALEDEWDYNMASFVEEKTFKNHSSCGKVAQKDEWDYYVANYYGTHKNRMSCGKEAQLDEWDYNMVNCYGTMQNLSEEETFKNQSCYGREAQLDEWDYKDDEYTTLRNDHKPSPRQASRLYRGRGANKHFNSC